MGTTVVILADVCGASALQCHEVYGVPSPFTIHLWLHAVERRARLPVGELSGAFAYGFKSFEMRGAPARGGFACAMRRSAIRDCAGKTQTDLPRSDFSIAVAIPYADVDEDSILEAILSGSLAGGFVSRVTVDVADTADISAGCASFPRGTRIVAETALPSGAVGGARDWISSALKSVSGRRGFCAPMHVGYRLLAEPQRGVIGSREGIPGLPDSAPFSFADPLVGAATFSTVSETLSGISRGRGPVWRRADVGSVLRMSSLPIKQQ